MASATNNGPAQDPEQLTPQGSGSWHTPIARTEGSSQVFGFGSRQSGEKYDRFAKEAFRFIIGVMPIDEFLDTFMDCARIMEMFPLPPTCLKRDLFKDVPQEPSDENSIYEPLIKVLNAGRGLCPGFTFKDTSAHADTRHGVKGSYKPDICCFSEVHLDRLPKHLHDHTDMGFAQLFIEVKRCKAYDPFSDPHPKATRRALADWEFMLNHTNQDDCDKAKESLGQNIAYATEIFARQHRHSCFSVCLHGTSARLMRWDRAGAIVTRAIDISSSPLGLCKFLWCFAHLTDTGRGYDLTVEAANEVESARFTQAIREHLRTQCPGMVGEALNEAANDHIAEGVVSAMHVFGWNTSDWTGKHHRCLVSRPIVYPLSPTGRATRGYWALDTSTDRVVFLKDTWRYEKEITGGVEGLVVQKLNESEVVNVPPLVYHGDVPSIGCLSEASDASLYFRGPGSLQVSQTQDFLTAPWRCATREGLRVNELPLAIVRHTHYRLVLGIAGRSIFDFSGTRELLNSCYDILLALESALKRTGRFHRDVSPTNIILYRHPGSAVRVGYLVDWDISCEGTFQPPPGVRQPLSAAWQFQSIRLLQATGPTGPQPIHTVQDDMESLLYVVLYCSFIWLPHNRAGNIKMLASVFKEMFDHFTDWGSILKGGIVKMANATSGAWATDFTWDTPQLNEWIREVSDLHRKYLSHDDERPHHRWTLDVLVTTWRQFLDKYTGILPQGDREYMLPGVLQGDASRTVAFQPYEPTRPSDVMSLGKRTIAEVSPDSPQEPTAKRPRLEDSPDADTHIPSSSAVPPDAMLTSEVERRTRHVRPRFPTGRSGSSRPKGRTATSPTIKQTRTVLVAGASSIASSMSLDERSSSPTPTMSRPRGSMHQTAHLLGEGSSFEFYLSSSSRSVELEPKSKFYDGASMDEGSIPEPVFAAQGPLLSDWRLAGVAPRPFPISTIDTSTSSRVTALPGTSNEPVLMSIDQRTFITSLSAVGREGQQNIAPSMTTVPKLDSALPSTIVTNNRPFPEPITASRRSFYREWQEAASIPQPPSADISLPTSGRDKGKGRASRDALNKEQRSSRNNRYSKKTSIRKTKAT